MIELFVSVYFNVNFFLLGRNSDELNTRHGLVTAIIWGMFGSLIVFLVWLNRVMWMFSQYRLFITVFRGDFDDLKPESLEIFAEIYKNSDSGSLNDLYTRVMLWIVFKKNNYNI